MNGDGYNGDMHGVHGTFHGGGGGGGGLTFGDFFDQGSWDTSYTGQHPMTDQHQFMYNYDPDREARFAAIMSAYYGDNTDPRFSSFDPTGKVDPISDLAPPGSPLGDVLNIKQWGTQNPNVPGSMALDPTWAGGLRGAGLDAESIQGIMRNLQQGKDDEYSNMTTDVVMTWAKEKEQMKTINAYLQGKGIANLDTEVWSDELKDAIYAQAQSQLSKPQSGNTYEDVAGAAPAQPNPDWDVIQSQIQDQIDAYNATGGGDQ